MASGLKPRVPHIDFHGQTVLPAFAAVLCRLFPDRPVDTRTIMLSAVVPSAIVDVFVREARFFGHKLTEAQIQDPAMRGPAMNLVKMHARFAMDAARDFSANRPGALFPLYETLIGFVPEGAVRPRPGGDVRSAVHGRRPARVDRRALTAGQPRSNRVYSAVLVAVAFAARKAAYPSAAICPDAKASTALAASSWLAWTW